MTFKYHMEIGSLELDDCPPRHYNNAEIIAFRFVFENEDHPNNFAPVSLINPKRLNDFQNHKQMCESFGLSMFASKEKANQFYQLQLLKTNGKFAKLVGNRIAVLNLLEQDGVFSEPRDKDSHFTFHESENTQLINRVLTIEPV